MNKVELLGRLTRDPEVRYTQTNNTLVASFSLAVNRRFVRQGEERQADFINIVAWSKLGEFCSKYFKKGQQVAIIGRIQTRTWDDDQGQKHYVTKLLQKKLILQKEEEMQMLQEVLITHLVLCQQAEIQTSKLLLMMIYHFNQKRGRNRWQTKNKIEETIETMMISIQDLEK